MRHQKQPAAGVGQRTIHPPGLIAEYTVSKQTVQHALYGPVIIMGLHRHQCQQPRLDFTDRLTVDLNPGLFHTLDQADHRAIHLIASYPVTVSNKTRNPGVRGHLAYLAFWLIGSLPLRWLHGLGAWLAGRQRGRAWHIVQRNLELCFPDMDPEQRQALAEQTLRESGRSMLEAFRIWTRPRRALGWIREVEGADLLEQARARGRGVLVLAPHLGAWELLNVYLASTGPGAVLYRPPASAAVEAAIVRSRGSLGMGLIRADTQAPRIIIRRLAAGELIGILPDQQPKIGEGVFAPFFGVSALTMTLAPRIAQRCTAVFGWAERMPGSAGYRVRFVPAPAALYDPDPVVATSAMNATIESMARQAPAQYAWTYKRFSRRPPGEPPRYGAKTRRPRNA